MTSYRSVLLGLKSDLNPFAAEWIPSSLKVASPSHTFWDKPEYVEPEFYTYKDHAPLINPSYKYYNTLLQLRTNPIFKKKFAIFAENMLCITDTDTEKGLRLDIPTWTAFDHTTWQGQKKKYVGFFLKYKQDDLTWSIAYECDDLEDPKTGWFMQWFHEDECCAYSCDYYGCHHNYKMPKTYIKDPVKRKKMTENYMKSLRR